MFYIFCYRNKRFCSEEGVAWILGRGSRFYHFDTSGGVAFNAPLLGIPLETMWVTTIYVIIFFLFFPFVKFSHRMTAQKLF